VQTNDLIRALLEVLEPREWLTELVDHDFGAIQTEEYACPDCESQGLRAEHKADCRYVAAVKAAREYLATPGVVENRTPMDAMAEAIQKVMPGLPVYPIDLTATIAGPTVTLTMEDGTQVVLPATDSKRMLGELVRDWWKAVYDPAIPPVEKKENAT